MLAAVARVLHSSKRCPEQASEVVVGQHLPHVDPAGGPVDTSGVAIVIAQIMLALHRGTGCPAGPWLQMA